MLLICSHIFSTSTVVAFGWFLGNPISIEGKKYHIPQNTHIIQILKKSKLEKNEISTTLTSPGAFIEVHNHLSFLELIMPARWDSNFPDCTETLHPKNIQYNTKAEMEWVNYYSTPNLKSINFTDKFVKYVSLKNVTEILEKKEKHLTLSSPYNWPLKYVRTHVPWLRGMH